MHQVKQAINHAHVIISQAVNVEVHEVTRRVLPSPPGANESGSKLGLLLGRRRGSAALRRGRNNKCSCEGAARLPLEYVQAKVCLHTLCHYVRMRAQAA